MDVRSQFNNIMQISKHILRRRRDATMRDAFWAYAFKFGNRLSV